ncbi:GGDEF domain-containing protein [uncultured Nevskia sp.]|uniref:GGDEF domain-containing protein n=1 Tax=uncultured Nevskia sp. TaxID=228950 RepID=UPI0025FDECA4|nr:GGDEF domain-containing protein [uncultured Nevskia sp.]
MIDRPAKGFGPIVAAVDPGSAADLQAARACNCPAEQQLKALQDENQSLRSLNEHLGLALIDITEQRLNAQHMAHHDWLTGLPNRQALMLRLHDVIAESFSEQCLMALMFIDIDDFKRVNDSHGHCAGDKLLTAVASRISSCIRANDLACRYGGDEFVVILSDISEASIAVHITEKLRGHINGCYAIDDEQLQISASIGLAFYPADGEQSEVLLNSADASMYRDKQIPADRRKTSVSTRDQKLLSPLEMEAQNTGRVLN